MPRRTLTFLAAIAIAVMPFFTTPLQAAPPEGFRPLFKRKRPLRMVRETPFSPIDLAKLSESERKAKIDEWTADAKQHWSVDNANW